MAGTRCWEGHTGSKRLGHGVKARRGQRSSFDVVWWANTSLDGYSASWKTHFGLDYLNLYSAQLRMEWCKRPRQYPAGVLACPSVVLHKYFGAVSPISHW